jgi:hypothetical protein
MNKQDKQIEKLSFIKEHECEALSKQDLITVTKYGYNGKNSWFWSYKNQSHQIAYCPYCGEELEKDGGIKDE